MLVLFLLQRQKLKPPIDAFGIVAAMSRNRVIGVDGKIPWDLPEDRKAFTALTRDKIIIIGRRTFEEQPNQSHIAHAHSCIIVSETLPDNFFEASNRLRLARSFPEALAMADELIDRSGASSSADEDEKNVDCWVAGGEQIYKEALMHPSARLVHLTIVDTEIDLVAGQVARFPAKYRWDNKFVKAETKDSSQDSDRHGFTRYVYRRPKLQR